MSNGDPIGVGHRGKSNAKRMGRYDGALTGTERRIKDELMNQFRRTGEGPGGNSDAYRDAPCWCACGRLVIRHGMCAKCEEAVPLGEHPQSEVVRVGEITIRSDPRMEGRPPLLLQTNNWVSHSAAERLNAAQAIEEPEDAKPNELPGLDPSWVRKLMR